MKRFRITNLEWSAVLSVVLVGTAVATPVPNGATIETRTFNDCPLSTGTTANNYPASIEISDAIHAACVGFANLHSWSFSEDGGGTAAVFENASTFCFGADVTIEGPGEGEGGLRVSPWWSPFVDGRFMVNATTGEIACFGGRLPFYSFTSFTANSAPGSHTPTKRSRLGCAAGCLCCSASICDSAPGCEVRWRMTSESDFTKAAGRIDLASGRVSGTVAPAAAVAGR